MEKLQLPAELESERKAITEALDVVFPGTWPEDEKVMTAEQPAAIARVLIAKLYTYLRNARIGYLFRESMKRHDRTELGKATKVATDLHYLSEYDFVMRFNWTAWRTLTPAQRIAIVDHELSHCGYDVEKGQYLIVHHDVEEFAGVIQRWGLWKSDLVSFGQIVAQLDMFSAEQAVDAEEDPTVTLSTDRTSVSMKSSEFHELAREAKEEPEAFSRRVRRGAQRVKEIADREATDEDGVVEMVR